MVEYKIMQSDLNRDNEPAGGASAQDVNTCPNCHTLMPSVLRFCRACGFRLGEGVAEYTETVRFQDAAHTSPAGKKRTGSAAASQTSSAGGKDWGAMAGRMSERTVKSVTSGLGQMKVARACKRVPRWMVWVIIPVMLASMTGIFTSNSARRNRDRSRVAANSPNSFLGGNYKTVDGGAFLKDIMPPGSAADKAGLIGGDIITSFDGKPVKSESDLSNLLTWTPVGKTVEITYLRDGETKTAQLTTISEKENSRLEEVFDDLPKGFLGVGDDFKRVQVPGTNIYGVRINEVYKNRPAYIAGLRDGDIIIEFDRIPIRTTEELNRRIDRARPDSTVTIVVMRGGERLEIPVKMGEE
jgi:membrane-associated protease RseP (regulator of RpoE activity)